MQPRLTPLFLSMTFKIHPPPKKKKKKSWNQKLQSQKNSLIIPVT